MAFFLPYWTEIMEKITDFKVVYVALFGKDPSWRSAVESDWGCVDDVIIDFGVWFGELFREVVFFFGEFLDVDKLDRLVLAETDNFVEGVIVVGFSARELPLVGFELFCGVDVPQLDATALMGSQ